MASPTATPFGFPGDRLFTRNAVSTTGPVSQAALGFSSVKITLTSAQILALQTTAVTLVAAPGAGYWIMPVFFNINVQGGSAAYTDAGGAVSFNVGSMTAALAANTVFTQGGSANFRGHQIFPFSGTATAAATPTNENAALTISKATNNFAAGNGTASIVIYYNVHESI
jgi:hypothetical protein